MKRKRRCVMILIINAGIIIVAIIIAVVEPLRMKVVLVECMSGR